MSHMRASRSADTGALPGSPAHGACPEQTGGEGRTQEGSGGGRRPGPRAGLGPGPRRAIVLSGLAAAAAAGHRDPVSGWQEGLLPTWPRGPEPGTGLSPGNHSAHSGRSGSWRLHPPPPPRALRPPGAGRKQGGAGHILRGRWVGPGVLPPCAQGTPPPPRTKSGHLGG